MNASAPFDPAAVATVTVTYNPDMSVLQAQLRALPETSLKIVVDNASNASVVGLIEDVVKRTPNTRLLRNSVNLGLAAAVNLGVRSVTELAPSARFALLLDQDSEPLQNSIPILVAAFQALEACGHMVGCVGPTLRDADTGLLHGFHQCTRWRWKRIYPLPGATKPVACANLNGSGTLVPVLLFLQMGGLEESLFVDHVDTEWAFRVAAAGYGLWGIPNAIFIHRMGQAGLRFWWFGWRVWPVRSPARHYFLFRNAVLLMRRPYVPRVWKTWAVAKLCLTAFAVLIIGPERVAQIRNIGRGINAGFTAIADLGT